MTYKLRKPFWAVSLMLLSLAACRDDDVIFIPENVDTGTPEFTDISGFYLLNEGNMGSNKSTLDYYDYATATYSRNIYASVNPNVAMELGDVGNDLAIYGNRLYAVINCSNKVEVMDAATCKRIGQVEIPNCRYIRFADGYAYVTSYAGPVEIDPNYKQKGYVAKIDTATLEVVDRCIVGYQPDGLEILSGKIYVANSGGYMSPNYENTLSVINLQNFEVEDTIPIAVNLHRIAADSHGQLWISSRGDYYTVVASLSCYDTRKQRITATLPITVSDFTIKGDSLYYIGVDRTFTSTSSAANSYGIVRVSDREQVSTNFITDGTESSIVVPYGIAVNPLTGDILVADARNYVNPGRLYCFSPQGVKRWDVRTGDIPAHIAFWGSTK